MHENYGGILQAYATVSYLENQNIEYELVRYTRKKTVTEALKVDCYKASRHEKQPPS